MCTGIVQVFVITSIPVRSHSFPLHAGYSTQYVVIHNENGVNNSVGEFLQSLATPATCLLSDPAVFTRYSTTTQRIYARKWA